MIERLKEVLHYRRNIKALPFAGRPQTLRDLFFDEPAEVQKDPYINGLYKLKNPEEAPLDKTSKV